VAQSKVVCRGKNSDKRFTPHFKFSSQTNLRVHFLTTGTNVMILEKFAEKISEKMAF
jgi:hypothetical protein